MLRSPQMLASPGLREVHKSIFLLSKEAPWCACPRHQKWSGVEGERTASGRPSSLRKDEKCQDFTKQKTIHIRQIYPSPCSSALLKPGPSDGLSPCPHTLPTDLLPLSQASFSRCVVITRQNHCQNYSLKGLLNPVDNLHRSDLTCLQQISHDQAGQQKTGAALPTTIRSKRCSHSPLSFVRGSQEFLFPRSVASSSQLLTCSSITVRPPQPPNYLSRLAVQSFRGMHTVAQLKVAPEYCLSTENEARCRKSLERNVVVYQNDKGKSWAAVLVSLCTVGGEPAFLFTLRSSTLKGRHKGDVSFAGGKKDPADQDVVTTALREAREELGITVSPNQVWGVLKPLRDMSGMMIAPVLANLGPLEALSFRPNPSEVEEIFTITLAHVCSPDNQGYTHFRVGERYGYTLPVFRNGKHRVWGLTAVALDHTLKLILPP